MATKSLIPAFLIVDAPADDAEILAGEVMTLFNASMTLKSDPAVPRIRLHLCEASPTTELEDEQDPVSLEGYTIDAGSDRSATALIARIAAFGRANDSSQPTETLSAILQIANDWLRHRIGGDPRSVPPTTPYAPQDAATLLLHAAAHAAAMGQDPDPERLRQAFQQAQAEHPGAYSHLLTLYHQQKKDQPA